MTPTKPYLLRAIYQWAIDNELTPQVLVDASHEGVSVPSAYVKDGQILLNVHPQAVNDLALNNDDVSFSARFGGNKWDVFFPMTAALAVFTRENGRGIFFQPEHDDTGADEGIETQSRSGPRSVPDIAPAGSESGSETGSDSSGKDPETPGPGRGRPNLRLVD